MAGPAHINSRESFPGAAEGTQPSPGQQCPGVLMSPEHLDCANPEHSRDFNPISLGLNVEDLQRPLPTHPIPSVSLWGSPDQAHNNSHS